ncbi:hypothetical protein NCS56_01544800 [Fusarium sp. Ph1]|nr:hypothetical protein NCS56_01544800 [Fusarium sp. Ph1]
MYILLGPLAVTLGTTSYYIWFLYSTSPPSKNSHWPQHGHSLKRSRLVKQGRLLDVSATFFQKHPRYFMILAFAFVILGICVMTAWAVLTFIQGGPWAIAFSATPALLSMLRECLWLISSRNPQQDAFSRLLPLVLCTAIVLTLGAILSIWFAKVGIFFIVLPAGAYRASLTWEWGKVLRDTIERPGPFFCMMMQATVLGVTCVAFGIRLARPWSTSIYTEILIISYGFVLLDLAMLLMGGLRLRCRYATTAGETRAVFAATNSTASLAEELAPSTLQYPPAVRAQGGGVERMPSTNLNDKGLGEYQTTVHQENEGVELTVQDVV